MFIPGDVSSIRTDPEDLLEEMVDLIEDPIVLAEYEEEDANAEDAETILGNAPRCA